MTPNVRAMSTVALRQLGISRDTPDRADNVWIEKDPSDEPTGRLHGSVTNYYGDSPFMHELLNQLPLLQLDAVVPGTERAMRTYNALGVTTVYEGHAMAFVHIELYRWLPSENRLTVRVLCAPRGRTLEQPGVQYLFAVLGPKMATYLSPAASLAASRAVAISPLTKEKPGAAASGASRVNTNCGPCHAPRRPYPSPSLPLARCRLRGRCDVR